MHDRRQAAGRGVSELSMDRLMTQMTAARVATSVGGSLIAGSRQAAISGVSIDSRTIRAGELFFAIRGPHADGHEFVMSSLSKGACGAVVDLSFAPPVDYPSDAFLIRVEDTHKALRELASEFRRQWRGSLVAVTGSVGKTTTKEFIADVLQSEYGVYRSPGNYNNLFGLPLSVFGLRSDHHIGVFEMGMSSHGEIKEMCRIARPDVGVITAVAAVHLEFFQNLEEIARAKAELAEALGSQGTLVYNTDDPLVRSIASRFLGPRISFGLESGADVRAEEIEISGFRETRFRLSVEGRSANVSLPVAGVQYVLNTLPAIALGRHYRIPLDQIVESLGDIRQAPMRGQVLRFKEGFTLIDDSYNSNPRALMLMTENLSRFKSSERRILVAGEMLELGPEADSLHRQCGSWAAQCGIDAVIGVQGAARALARGAIESGIPEENVRFYDDASEAVQFLSTFVRAGDLVLVKGSRGVRLEKIVQKFRAEHEMEED
jgi:UDP-N-acetylmuramoyl-tripeptide--D-alanyl-D-alanine ligase